MISALMSRQWTLPIELREFRQEDYGRLAHVFGQIFPDYDRTPEEWKFEDESLDKSKFHFKRYSCTTKESPEPVGFAQCQHVPWMYHSKKLWFDIWVDPQHQRKGIGSALYERLSQDFKDLRTVTSWTGVKEDMPYPIKFATNRGFHEKMRAWDHALIPRQSTSHYSKSMWRNRLSIEFTSSHWPMKWEAILHVTPSSTL